MVFAMAYFQGNRWPGLTDRDHEEHSNKNTESVDNENDTATYLFGKYGIWNREKETFTSISVYSNRESHVVAVLPAQLKSPPTGPGAHLLGMMAKLAISACTLSALHKASSISAPGPIPAMRPRSQSATEPAPSTRRPWESPLAL